MPESSALVCSQVIFTVEDNGNMLNRRKLVSE
jgi:hypothetical protein